MATAATLAVTIRFQTSPSFGPNLVLGDSGSPLDTGVLSDADSTPVDVTSKVNSATISRGRDRILDKHEAGSATIVMTDTDGTFDPDNGTYANEILPMRQLQLKATYSGTTYTLFSGFIEEWDYRYQPGETAATITVTASDAFRILNLTDIGTVAGASAGDLTGTRIGEILDEISWPTSSRDFSNGMTTCQADPGGTRDTLTACQTITDTELGAFYTKTNGVLKFLDRDAIIKLHAGTADVYDDSAGANIQYQSLDFALDETVLANKVAVTRSGGSTQSVSDTASINSFFERDLSRSGLLMDSDADALNQAKTILAGRKDPELRVSTITLDATADVSNRVVAALSTDFFQPIKVTRTQPGGGTVTRTLSVQGIQHAITPDTWTTRFTTTERILAGFILDSATDGKLGTNVLSY